MSKRKKAGADRVEPLVDTARTRSRPPSGTTRAASDAGLVQLFPRSADGAPRVWVVTGSEVLGRGKDASIHVEDSFVSRRHAEVRRGDAGLLLRDLGSRDGLSVCGVVAGSEDVLARFGEIIRVGDTLLLVVDDVDRHRASERTIHGPALGLENDVTAGSVLSNVWDQATRVAALPHPVLIQGETGTGKEAVARIIHAAMGRERPFVGINVAAIPEQLFEAELFGHERGAFTGAVSSRAGAFREADGGVLFLDEIADLRLDLQAKLLRAIDLQTVRPVGSGRDVTVRVRVLAATSEDIQARCEDGRFRADLFYRLRGAKLQVPALRQRPEDVILLALATVRSEAPALTLSTDAAEALLLGEWPGNARELRYAVSHAISQALATNATSLLAAHLPEIRRSVEERGPVSEPQIRRAMSRSSGVAAKAAALLGVSRTTFYNSCRRLGIETSTLREDPS